MERSRLGIIIPALNEATTIASVVTRAITYGTVIVVDDGSTDETAELALFAGAQVVSHVTNRGYDAALNSGFAKAQDLGCSHAVTIDADGQHNPDQLVAMIAYLDQGYALVFGVRDRHQRLAEAVYAWFSQLLWNITDPLCGMKAYSLVLYQDAGCFDSCNSIGSELAVRSVAHGCRYTEIPIITLDRLDTPRFGRAMKANFKILRAMAIMLLRYRKKPA